MGTSLQQVADLAGVAPVTVSRVLNAPGKVAPHTRAKVERAMERLGYVPDLVASSLASRRSRMVALLLPNLGHPMVDFAIRGLSAVLHRIDYHVIIGETGYDAPNSLSFVTAMLGRRPEAIVVIGPVRDPRARRLLQASGILVIQIWDLPDDEPIGRTIGFDNHAAAYAMAKHLIGRGRRHLAFFGVIGDKRVHARHAAFRRCLADRAMTSSFDVVLGSVDPFYDATDDFARLMDAHPRTDAVFCDTDSSAQTVLFACLRRGWKVPERIAVAGFGDFPLSARLIPSLTSIRVHPYRMGQRAGEVIIDHLGGATLEPVVEDLGFEIVAREST